MRLKKDYSYGLIPFKRDVSNEPRYLIARSSSGDKFWKFPKGHKDEGEEDLAAACRETSEEIGINVGKDDVLTNRTFEERYTYKSQADEVQKTNTFWLAEVSANAEVELNKEFSEYRWVTFPEACEFLPDNSQSFLAQAHQYLKDKG